METANQTLLVFKGPLAEKIQQAFQIYFKGSEASMESITDEIVLVKTPEGTKIAAEDTGRQACVVYCQQSVGANPDDIVKLVEEYQGLRPGTRLVLVLLQKDGGQRSPHSDTLETLAERWGVKVYHQVQPLVDELTAEQSEPAAEPTAA